MPAILSANNKLQFYAQVVASSGDVYTPSSGVTWTSSNPGLVSIDAGGVATVTSPGPSSATVVTVTATYQGVACQRPGAIIDPVQ